MYSPQAKATPGRRDYSLIKEVDGAKSTGKFEDDIECVNWLKEINVKMYPVIFCKLINSFLFIRWLNIRKLSY